MYGVRTCNYGPGPRIATIIAVGHGAPTSSATEKQTTTPAVNGWNTSMPVTGRTRRRQRCLPAGGCINLHVDLLGHAVAPACPAYPRTRWYREDSWCAAIPPFAVSIPWVGRGIVVVSRRYQVYTMVRCER